MLKFYGLSVDGLYAIEQSVLSQDKFGVIITDMWYPRESRGAEDQCGLEN